MFLWLGADVDESYWQDLFGVPNSHALNPVPVCQIHPSNS